MKLLFFYSICSLVYVSYGMHPESGRLETSSDSMIARSNTLTEHSEQRVLREPRRNVSVLLLQEFAASHEPLDFIDMLCCFGAASGDINIVRQALEANADVNAHGPGGWTALHYACGEGFIEIVQILLANGAFAETFLSNGRTPLYCAVANKRHEVVAELLKWGVNPSRGITLDYTPLYAAIGNEHPANVQALLLAGADPNTKHHFRVRPITIALNKNNGLLVHLLIKSGGAYDFDTTLKARVSKLYLSRPLLYELLFGSQDEYKSLLSLHNQSPQHYDDVRDSFIICQAHAIEGLTEELYSALSEADKRLCVIEALRYAVARGNSAFIPRLIEFLAPKIADHDDDRCLSELLRSAVMRNNKAVVECLLAAGAPHYLAQKYLKNSQRCNANPQTEAYYKNLLLSWEALDFDAASRLSTLSSDVRDHLLVKFTALPALNQEDPQNERAHHSLLPLDVPLQDNSIHSRIYANLTAFVETFCLQHPSGKMIAAASVGLILFLYFLYSVNQ